MARLRRSRADDPGWTRRRHGRGVVYVDQTGGRIEDPELGSAYIDPRLIDLWERGQTIGRRRTREGAERAVLELLR